VKKLGIILSVIIAISLMAWAAPIATAHSNNATGSTGNITITLEAGQYEINEVGEYSVIGMEGFGSIINPGEPRLPSKTFLVGLPPGAEAVSVDMVTSDYVEIPGEYRIMPAPPIVSWQQDEKVKWGENEEIYSSENAYPVTPYEYLGMGQMRKYNFARVRFCPIVYYPASNKLSLYRSITLKIKYEISQVLSPELLSDTVMDGVASQIIFNYAPMKSKYQSAAAPSPVPYDYVIITTESLQSAVEPLVTWKTAIGYSVNVVTTTWISGNYPGGDLPEKIRNFLRDKYAEWGIEYVLIVGSHSTIPMRYCYPDSSDHDPNSDSTTPTDYYYADLTGNWDSDGDGYFGEYGQDDVDFHPEVYVGRIPIDDSTIVNSICQKSVNFEQDSGAWKKKALLLGAIYNYEGELYAGYSLPGTDGAALMEECWNDILSGNGYSRETMYEKEGLSPSTYACDHPLTNSNVASPSYGWPSGYGIVNFGGHGWIDGAYREVWATDDGDGIPESNEIDWHRFISSKDAGLLNDSKPAIVFAAACSTSYPEKANNFGKSMLKQGAVAFVGATRSPRYATGWQNGGDGLCQSSDYFFFDYLVNEERKCGDALYLSQVWNCDYLPWPSWSFWQNILAFCLYGDPSLGTATISLSENPDLHTHLWAVMGPFYTPADLNHARICLSSDPYGEVAEAALGTYGIDYMRVYVPSSESFLALKTGVVDAVLVTEHPWDAVLADDFETEVRFLPWSQQAIEAVMEQFSWVASAQLPANTYPWQIDPVPGYAPQSKETPNIPCSPSPPNHATGVSIDAVLSWAGGDPDPGDTVTYDVYLGTSSPPPFKESVGPYPAAESSIMCDVGTLSYNTKYYWRIVATDNHAASTTGPLWDFTTGSIRRAKGR